MLTTDRLLHLACQAGFAMVEHNVQLTIPDPPVLLQRHLHATFEIGSAVRRFAGIRHRERLAGQLLVIKFDYRGLALNRFDFRCIARLQHLHELRLVTCEGTQ